MAASHTPTPWEIDPDDDAVVQNCDGGMMIATVSQPDDFPCRDEDEDESLEEECKANAAFIVRVCNAHDDLVQVLWAARDALRSYQYGNSATDLAKGIADACDAALAKVEALS